MVPADVPLAETYAFCDAALGDRRRILDVGCGRGALAGRLAAAGREVIGLDRSLGGAKARGATLVEGDFLVYRAAPVDALLFVTSLHHLHPLGAAVERAAELLVPGGLVIAEEIDLDAPDAATATWYYDVQELLAAAELCPPAHVHGSPDAEPLARWRGEHAHDPPLAEPLARWRGEHAHDPPLACGQDMFVALASRFDVLRMDRGPYLYRYFCDRLEASQRAANVGASLLAAERRKIAAGSLRATGLRMIARRRESVT